MARIRNKDTSPERRVRRVLTALKLRYRLNVCGLPGRPDIVLRRLGRVIFIHGCFWHLHSCRDGTLPKTRIQYWKSKLEGNRKRDEKNIRRLRADGWKVLRLWECDIERRPLVVNRKIAVFFE